MARGESAVESDTAAPGGEETSAADRGDAAVAAEVGAETAGSSPGGIRSGNLAGRSLASAVMVIAGPVMLEQFAAALVGLVDRLFAGHLPEGVARPALDGVGLASYLTWFIGIAMAAFGVGGMALIARAMGSGDRVLAHKALGQSLVGGVVWGCFVGVFMWFSCAPLARIAHLSPEATKYCTQYIRVFAVGMPWLSYLMVAMNCLHGAGETTRPFLIMLVVNVVHVFASWALSGVDLAFGSWTLANPFSIDLHVQGIAVGTVAAQAVGALLMHLLMVHGIRDLRLESRWLAPDWGVMWRVVRIGLPSFFDGLGMWAGQLIAVMWLMGMIARTTGQSEGLMGAHEIAVQWESFSFMPGFALGIAAGTLAGQFLGAGNPKRAAQSMWVCAIAAMTLMGSAGIVFMTLGEALTRIVSDDPVHLDLAPKALFLCGLVQVFFALAMVMRGGLRGAGDTRACLYLTWSSTYLVRIPLAWFLGHFMAWGFVGVWAGLCIELVIRGLLFLGRFLHGGWKTVRV